MISPKTYSPAQIIGKSIIETEKRRLPPNYAEPFKEGFFIGWVKAYAQVSRDNMEKEEQEDAKRNK